MNDQVINEMESEDTSLQNKREILMNAVVETRQRFGRICADYEQKTLALEKNLMNLVETQKISETDLNLFNLHTHTFSKYKLSFLGLPRNPAPTPQSDAAEIKEFADELMKMAKGFEDAQQRNQNSIEIMEQFKADCVRMLRELLDAENNLN